MKKIKLVFILIILVLLGLLVYQNADYFFAKHALSLNLGLESWKWTTPGVQNIGYLGICLAAGLLITGIKGLGTRMRLKKEVKLLKTDIESYLEQISSLKTELEKFKNDPYRKKEVTNQALDSQESNITVQEQ